MSFLIDGIFDPCWLVPKKRRKAGRKERKIERARERKKERERSNSLRDPLNATCDDDTFRQTSGFEKEKTRVEIKSNGRCEKNK